MCEIRRVSEIGKNITKEDPNNLVDLYDKNEISRNDLINKIEDIESDSVFDNYKFFFRSIFRFFAIVFRSTFKI